VVLRYHPVLNPSNWYNSLLPVPRSG